VFYVLVSGLPLTYLSTFKAGDVAGLPLRTWRHETLLEHELSRILHSHKQFIFTYGS
jgi:uncharacterized protein YmfQ (DUF2313 family)